MSLKVQPPEKGVHTPKKSTRFRHTEEFKAEDDQLVCFLPERPIRQLPSEMMSRLVTN